MIITQKFKIIKIMKILKNNNLISNNLNLNQMKNLKVLIKVFKYNIKIFKIYKFKIPQPSKISNKRLEIILSKTNKNFY